MAADCCALWSVLIHQRRGHHRSGPERRGPPRIVVFPLVVDPDLRANDVWRGKRRLRSVTPSGRIRSMSRACASPPLSAKISRSTTGRVRDRGGQAPVDRAPPARPHTGRAGPQMAGSCRPGSTTGRRAEASHPGSSIQVADLPARRHRRNAVQLAKTQNPGLLSIATWHVRIEREAELRPADRAPQRNASTVKPALRRCLDVRPLGRPTRRMSARARCFLAEQLVDEHHVVVIVVAYECRLRGQTCE